MCVALEKQQHSEAPCWSNVIPYHILLATAMLAGGGGSMFLLAKTQRVYASKQLEGQAKHHHMLSHEPRILPDLFWLGPSKAQPRHLCGREWSIWQGRNRKQNCRTVCQTQFPITLWSIEKLFIITNRHIKYILWWWSVKEVSNRGNTELASMPEVSKVHPITSSWC